MNRLTGILHLMFCWTATTVVVVSLCFVLGGPPQPGSPAMKAWATICDLVAKTPTICWWRTAGVLYLAICYLGIGPWITRNAWPNYEAKTKWMEAGYPPLELVWAFVPLWILLYPMIVYPRKFLVWLIYGPRDRRLP